MAETRIEWAADYEDGLPPVPASEERARQWVEYAKSRGAKATLVRRRVTITNWKAAK